MRAAPLFGPPSGGEDHRVGAGDDGGDVRGRGLLEVEYDAPGTDLLEVGDVVGVADQADGLVTRLGELPLEPQGDLAVSAGDDDAHVLPSVGVVDGEYPCPGQHVRDADDSVST